MRNSRKNNGGVSRDHLFAVRLMEHLVVPTFVLDADGRVLIWNRACERLTGLSASDVIGTDLHWRGFYDARRPCLADVLLQKKEGELKALYAEHTDHSSGQINLFAENWCVMPNVGSRRYLAIDAGPIFDEEGRLIAVVETLRDITAQKEAQLALKALVTRDGLTGIANRRMFDETLEEEWRRAKRDAAPVSLLMIDIDHFKGLNDTLGHQRGDECLRQVADIISGEMLRPGDMVARYGGEEFAVILPKTSLEGALAVADRILTAVEAHSHGRIGSGSHGAVTVSIGAASSEGNCADSASLITLADEALYQAKRAGRNRVVASASDQAAKDRCETPAAPFAA
jgi:diguanylate cyclase (GGDEF)-like protein/PAS domain S-box-containing protein